MSVIVIGCLEETLDTLAVLSSMGNNIDSIITLPRNEAEKLNITNWVCLKSIAEKMDVPIYYAQSYEMKGDVDHNLIKSLNPSSILVVGWQRLIPLNIIEESKNGAIGFHGSSNFLPWGRGRSPINWSIIEGKNRFILHMFQITPGIDDGEILGVEVYEITPDDTCRSVYYKTSIAQARLIHQYYKALSSGKLISYPQQGQVFEYHKRTPADGNIAWNFPAIEILRLIRAVTSPYPGAFTHLGGEKIIIWSAQYFGDDLLVADAQPGEIVFISNNKRKEFVVKCGQGSILATDFEASEVVEIQKGKVFYEK